MLQVLRYEINAVRGQAMLLCHQQLGARTAADTEERTVAERNKRQGLLQQRNEPLQRVRLPAESSWWPRN